LQATIDGLEREHARLTAALASLEAQLLNAPSEDTVATMRRELRILKSLEYNAIDADSDKDPELTSSLKEEDLETVLVAKLRKVESELVRERNERKTLSEQVDEMEEKVTFAEKEKKEAELLVASLESDLHKAVSAGAKGETEVVPDENAPASNSTTLRNMLDPSADGTSKPLTKPSSVEKVGDHHSVATIVMAQRDRLRARCDALEAERDSFKKELQAQVQSSESLKTDNSKLYEKVKYLQTFGSSGNRRGKMNAQDRDLDLEALEQRYEASVDPFRQFGRAERQRKLQEMSPAERIVFIVAKTVLGTKQMRTALFFYMLGMHLLVFLATYGWSHGCHNDVYNDANYAHMHGGAPPKLPAPNALPGSS